LSNKEGNAKALQALFPCHQNKYLAAKISHYGWGEIDKKVWTVHRSPTLEDFVVHLDNNQAKEDVLGVFPTFLAGGGGRRGWFVKVLALDYDASTMEQVMPLVALLEDHGIYAYLDTGTTDRGCHLYVFLADPLPQHEAYAALAKIANLSQQLGLPYPETFPSNATTAGKGILLPYRGAAEDGIGANHLIDPTTGTAIPLMQAEDEIYRTDLSDLKGLIASLECDKTGSELAHNVTKIETYSDAIGAWEAEVLRVEPYYGKTRRQNLVMGLSGYGMHIGVPPDRIRKDIETLGTKFSDPELVKRLGAVDGTIGKFQRGERVAYRKFYQLAGLEPPASNKAVSWDVILRVKAFEDKLHSEIFKGMGGFTDLDIAKTLVEIARKYGKHHPSGVEVSISVRELALSARVTSTTACASLTRLSESGWVSRSNRGRGANSGALVLLVNGTDLDSLEAQGDTSDKFSEEPLIHIPKFRWGAGKLGKTSRLILQKIHQLQPCTRAEIAKAMGKQSRDIKAPLNRLKEHYLVDYDEETRTHSLPDNLEDTLFEVLLDDGTLETDVKHKNRYKLEQARFKALLALRREMKYARS
jgi:predicted transcriptional regulator